MDNRLIDADEQIAAGPAPRIATELPGPRSRELLARGAATLYPGLQHGLAPFVVASKSGHTITDVDGNVFVDLVSASGSVPLGAARAELIEPAVDVGDRVAALRGDDERGEAVLQAGVERRVAAGKQLAAARPGQVGRDPRGGCGLFVCVDKAIIHRYSKRGRVLLRPTALRDPQVRATILSRNCSTIHQLR